MRSARRRAQKTDVKKNRASNPAPRAFPGNSRTQRLVPGVDYARITPEEIRRLGQLRVNRWKDPAQLPDTLLNSPDFQNQQRVRQARRRTEAPPANVNTQRTRTFNQLTQKPDSLVHQALECVGRKIKRQLTFAFDGVGKGRSYPDRKPPSKVKC